jgi:hypothetical protein
MTGKPFLLGQAWRVSGEAMLQLRSGQGEETAGAKALWQVMLGVPNSRWIFTVADGAKEGGTWYPLESWVMAADKRPCGHSLCISF